MKAKTELARLTEGFIGRRDFLKILASVGLVVATTRIRPARAAENLSVFTWASYEDPNFHKAYLDKHGGTEPDFAFFAEEEEAFQKLRGGFRSDIAHPCSASVRRWRDGGLLKPLDVSRIEQWENIFPNFKEIRGVTVDGQTYLCPWDWGNESVLYRTDLVEPKEQSFNLYLDERYKGKMAFLDSVDSIAAVGGLLAGAKQPFAMTDEEIEKVRVLARQIHANMRMYTTGSSDLTQAMASGEVVIGQAWNQSLGELKAAGIPVTYMHPKEGTTTFVCGMTLVEGSKGDEAMAYDFINAMMDPQSGKALVETLNYGHANREAMKLVAPEKLAELGFSDPENFLKSGLFFDEMPADTREKLIRMWEEVKAGR